MMKQIDNMLLACAVLAVLTGFFGGCSPAVSKMIVQDALDVAVAECIAEHPGYDKPTLQKICKWADTADKLVDRLLASQRVGMAKIMAASPSCPKPDGGT